LVPALVTTKATIGAPSGGVPSTIALVRVTIASTSRLRARTRPRRREE